MNKTIEDITCRRSTRAFKEKEISREDLELIVSTAYKAPSGMNKQTWRFVAIKNKKLIKSFADAVGAALGREGYNFYGPDALVICANDKESRFAAPDCACALENMFIAAQSIGISSVWINQLNDCCDDPRVRELLDEVMIPSNYGVYGCAALGYKADEAPSEPTPKNEDVVRFYW